MGKTDKSNTPLTLNSLIKWGNGNSEMSEELRAKTVNTVWNDSRKVQQGDVFLALRTDNDDGHRYIESAFQNGAISAIVDKSGIMEVPEQFRSDCIVVSDTLEAVQTMAASYRKEMGLLVIGITGSNGKTTTRTFISSIFKQVIKVGETYTNWNNHIGVPLSILRFDGDEWAGVIEMGANHVNEIHGLSKIAAPDIAVITNIGYAHVGLFGSLENTTKAKFEIADGLSSDGFMLLNGDDPRLVKGASERGLKTVFYGTSPQCDIRAENVEISAQTGLKFTVDEMEISLAMPGKHFMYCILPAIYLARRCKIPDALIAETIANLKPASMRGMVEKRQGIRFILDCYNANPSSMSNAISYLCDITPNQKQRVAVVGDMLELEQYTEELHVKLGAELVKSGVHKIIAVGNYSDYIARGAINEKLSSELIHTAKDAAEALEIAKEFLNEDETVLLKGSRGVKLEKVFEGFSS
ncbi:UDP-N-acetylmuramoyl-tripeptide--D-alanyl-D-alanine ligase [Chitinispirillales bacterium ANBcel5]|uniref:UDP-N-acetylmuramoyl-tripeptide--D-alanyl-D- alanine ligase n=1 Tax=Cellulosispirillum alkaliphilum TaxID=3039283 RepID=UPI002A55B716|nr:UDP-N-acetylmuramoyl-tripeptide--D-alanyl-D-alanine ligase [Chitinispirillales bacterium ANBcel5]